MESSLFRWKLVAAASLSTSLVVFCIGLAPAGGDAEFKRLTVLGELMVKDGKTDNLIHLSCSPDFGAAIMMKSQNHRAEVKLGATEDEVSPPLAWVAAATSEEVSGSQNKGVIYATDEGGKLQLFRKDKGKTFDAPAIRGKQ